MSKPIKNKQSSKFRLNLELNAEVKDLLDKATVSSNAASNTEVIRRSIALFSAVMDRGGVAYVEDENGEKERIRII